MSTKIPAEYLIESNISSGPISNVVDTTKPGMANCQIGVHIYRSLNNDGEPEPFKNHIRGFCEPNSGGHYYVKSYFQDLYTSASFSFKPSEASLNNKGKRNAYVSLNIGVMGTIMGGCDIGFANVSGISSEWYPYSWSKDNRTGGQNPMCEDRTNVYTFGTDTRYYIDPNKTSYCRIEIVTAGNIEKVIGTFSYNSNFSSPYATITYESEAKGQFFSYHWSSQKPLVRFVRFMSLVPKNGDETDDKDDSFLNAYMRNLKLGSGDWGNDLTSIQFAWSVQGANINLLQISGLTSTGPTNGDYIEIIHRYQLH